MKKQKKQILMIGLTPPIEGGSEMHIYEVASRIAKISRFDIKVFTQKNSICKDKIGIVLPKQHPLRILFFIFNLLLRLPKIMFLKYQIIHVHENYLFFFLPIFRIRFKTIATVHGIEGFKFYDNKFLWFFYKQALKAANIIIAVSKEDKQLLEREFKNVVHIPNGVDTPLYDKIRTKTEKRIMFIGRIHEQKGIIYLLKAFSLLTKQFPEFRLHIIGKINEYALGLKKEFPDKRIIWHGYISDRKAIAKLLKSAYCIVLPSLWEGLPLTLFEALASARPVIVSRIPSMNIINENKNALFVNPADSADLSKKIILLIKNKKKANLIGKAGRKLAERYSWDNIALETSKVYESLFRK